MSYRDYQNDANRRAMMGWAADELRRQGVPEANVRAAASHMVGQADAESGLNPNTLHDNGTGYGIYGARDPYREKFGRRTAMLFWLARNGYAPNSAEGQMRQMVQSAMSGEYPRTRSILMNANPDRFESDSRAITGEFESPGRINNRSLAVRNAYGAGVTPVSLEAPSNALYWDSQKGAFADPNANIQRPTPETPYQTGQRSAALYPYAKGVKTENIDALHPSLQSGLAKAFQDMPENLRSTVRITSGYRSPQDQYDILTRKFRDNGIPATQANYERGVTDPRMGIAAGVTFDANGNLIGSRSQHANRAAVDLNGTSPEALQWLYENGPSKYGIENPSRLRGADPAHFQLVGAGGSQPMNALSSSPSPPQDQPGPQNYLTQANLNVNPNALPSAQQGTDAFIWHDIPQLPQAPNGRARSL